MTVEGGQAMRVEKTSQATKKAKAKAKEKAKEKMMVQFWELKVIEWDQRKKRTVSLTNVNRVMEIAFEENEWSTSYSLNSASY